jgi:GTPase involved in cell partitioning and DNA repair
MAPKKGSQKEEKILLGRPSNNLKIGVVGLPNVGKSVRGLVLRVARNGLFPGSSNELEYEPNNNT